MGGVKMNLELENKIVELLGYKIGENQEAYCETYMPIKDIDDKDVGYIEYKKIKKQKSKKTLRGIYGYILRIDSDIISLTCKRRENQKYGLLDIRIKKMGNIELVNNDNLKMLKINIRTDKEDIINDINFFASNNAISLESDYKTDKSSLSEKIFIENDRCLYDINYSKFNKNVQEYYLI